MRIGNRLSDALVFSSEKWSSVPTTVPIGTAAAYEVVAQYEMPSPLSLAPPASSALLSATMSWCERERFWQLVTVPPPPNEALGRASPKKLCCGLRLAPKALLLLAAWLCSVAVATLLLGPCCWPPATRLRSAGRPNTAWLLPPFRPLTPGKRVIACGETEADWENEETLLGWLKAAGGGIGRSALSPLLFAKEDAETPAALGK